MANDTPNSDDLHPRDLAPKSDGASPQPFLQMRPRHFFSNKFDMEIIDDYSKAQLEEGQGNSPKWLNRLMSFDLFWMILIVGVPILAYCIVASAK